MGRRSWLLTIVVTAVATAYFAPLGDWVADDPLPGQAWMKQHTGLALGVLALVTLLAGALTWQRKHAEPVPDRPFDRDSDGYLDDVRTRMKVVWIDEFLARSLERIVPAKLGFEERRDAITSPLRVIGTSDLPSGIIDIFLDPRTARRLLVLGAPGAGKTTQLLRLAEHLLNDPAGPVPVMVSLTGSSWTVDPYKLAGLHLRVSREEESEEDNEMREKRLEEAKRAQIELTIDTAVGWISDEISRLYQVPARRVERWLRADRSPVVLLLDGLDEIRDPSHRRRCVETLSLLRSHLHVGMVVCCRTVEYFELGRKLAFGAAAEIMPLSPQEVDAYLADAGDELVSLRAACRHSPALAQLLRIPLTLTVAVLAYRGKQVDEAMVRELLAHRLDHLWSAYLDITLARQRGLTSKVPFTPEQSLKYAHGLALLMETVGRDRFDPDDLDLSWLRGYHWAAQKLVRKYQVFAACFGVVVSGLAWLAAGPVIAVLSTAVLVLSGWTYFRADLAHTGGVSVRWSLDWDDARNVAPKVVLPCLAAGMAVGTVGGNLKWMDGFHGLLLGLLPGAAAGLTAAVLALPYRRRSSTRRRAGDAARRTLAVRLTAGLVALTPMATAPLLSLAVAEPLRPAMLHLTIAMVAGIWLSGFARSLQGWWSHRSALRDVVIDGVLPLDVESFLTHTEDRVITRYRLDGHWFLHRTLQTHLAQRTLTRPKPGPPGRQGELPAARPDSAD
ncbi:AAA family ATPase [Lentzea sp. NPDC051838]|uniref:NACHT domain-containing protein n=1 Tax=Lentzea sp. NPDC051838 TaxID=3154849 RepID=UPI003436E122